MIDLGVLENGSFVQRIMALDEIEKSGDPALVAPLVELFGKDGLDESLRQALSDTLRAVLLKNPAIVNTVLGDVRSPAIKIAVQLAGHLKLSDAGDALAALTEKAEGDLLVDAISSLGQIGGASHLETFRRFASHPDPFASAAAIRQLGASGDTSSIPFLKELIVRAENDGEYETCSFPTGAAVEALAALPGDEAQKALADKIHHRNPTVRRLIHEELVSRGESAVSQIAVFLEKGDIDEKIMAAALLGQIKSTKGAEYILAAMDKGLLNDPNVKFAVYDAFGHIPSLKTMICLIDGLSETDQMTLVAVVTSLNRMVNPGVIARVGAALGSGGIQAESIAAAIIAAQAAELFKALYPAGGLLSKKALASKDPSIREIFAATLNAMGTPEALADASILAAPAESSQKKRILAVDDSRSIIMFYRAMLSELGYEVVTADNGKLALDVLGLDTAFDLIITDMNMPEMNGVELTLKVRENMFTESIPVIMATTESDKSQIDLADRAGVTGYLVKPIKPDSLKEAMAKIFA